MALSLTTLIILVVIPWFVLLVFFVGEKWQQGKVIGALDKALERAQGGVLLPPAVQLAPARVIEAAPVPPSLPAPVAPKALPSSDFPDWYQWALHEVGTHEVGNNGGPAIERYIALAKCGTIGDPWCAIFLNAALESCGVAGTRSPSSQSFAKSADFVKLEGPARGAIVVFWRISQSSGLGHVGFYRGEDASRIWTLGGNESDMVQIEALAKASDAFGLVGYYWPKSRPLPAIGAVLMPAGSATSMQAPPANLAPAAPGATAVQTGIVATIFSSRENDNRSTAYGVPLDDNAPGVALPFHFRDARPQVQLTNPKNGKQVVAAVVDVGPWNTNDPYWLTGARPQAEGGVDLGQTGSKRKTNGAGIDLTPAAAAALAIDGKGLVNWEFVESPQLQPKVT